MKLLFISLAMVIFGCQAQAQRTFANINFQLNFPQNEYRQANPVTGAGLRLNIMNKIAASQLSLGGEVGFLVTGSDSRYFDLYYYGIIDRYRISATNNIVSLAFKARFDLVEQNQPIQYFVDGTIGTNLFFSSVDTERETFFGTSQNAGGTSSKGYWAFAWGPGAGVDIALGKRREIFLTIKGSYLLGSNTKYLKDPYIDNNGEVYFTQEESKTDMIVAEAGVKVGLFSNRKSKKRERESDY